MKKFHVVGAASHYGYPNLYFVLLSYNALCLRSQEVDSCAGSFLLGIGALGPGSVCANHVLWHQCYAFPLDSCVLSILGSREAQCKDGIL